MTPTHKPLTALHVRPAIETSLFDFFKIGPGPSSSHTIGPMRAGHDFVQRCDALDPDLVRRAARIHVVLLGSLSATGMGHGTNTAVLAGLLRTSPETCPAGLLDKLGLGRQTLTTAPYKDAGSMLEPLTADEKAYFQGVLKDMHEQFVDIVAQGRHMDRTRAARLATGKIFTGREAVELGLVDELGGQQAAHRWLADVCKVPADRPLLTPPSEDEWWEKSLKTWFGLDADALLGREAPAFLYSF